MERSDKLPGALEDAQFLDFQDRGIGVEARGERMRAFDLLVHVEVERLCGHKRKLTVDSLQLKGKSRKQRTTDK